MSETPTMTDLEKLKELLDAATPGPWEHVLGDTSGKDVLGPTGARRVRTGVPEDAALITEAVSALPALIAEIEAARKVVEAAQQMIDNANGHYMHAEDHYVLTGRLDHYQEVTK